MNRAAWWVWVVAFGSAVCGCNKGADASAGTSGGAPAASATVAAAGGGAIDEVESKSTYANRCATCHGANGDGNGPGAAALNPKPRNYTDKEWQKKVTDEDLKKVIVYGGAAVGKSPIMPASPDLDGKPAVVAGLIKVVRDFGK